MDLENNFYAVQFAVTADYYHALLDGPWVVRGTYLTVQPWSPSFTTKKSRILNISIWVRLPGLPFNYYHKNIIRAMGSLLSNVLKIDYNTNLGVRGQFAHMGVEIDVSKPMIPGFMLDDRYQRIEYEGLPAICFQCGIIGHLARRCTKSVAPKLTS